MTITLPTRPTTLTALLALQALTSSCLAPVDASQDQPADITIDRLFDGDFSAARFGPARWLADGSLATLVNASTGSGRDLLRYDPAADENSILVSARQLTPAGRDQPLAVADYTFSSDGDKVLVFTNTRRVWRYHTRGDYWVLNRSTGALQQLGRGLDAARLQFAKFDPAGERVAYLYRHDIYVEHLATGACQRLTHGGSDTLTNGTFDWVYEEEWGLRDGFRWSPDGRSVAFWQVDASQVQEFTLINNTAGLYSVPFRYRYPKVGTTNPSARVGVVELSVDAAADPQTAAASSADSAPPIRWMQVPGDPSQDYIARMEWAANSSELVLQHFNRLQNRNQVRLADAGTGVTRVVYTDEGEAWVEECDDLRWFDGGARFLWVSERDGWRHIYVISRDGRESRLLTPGDYDVVSIQHIDERSGWIYFIASPDDPTQRFLYRTRIEGSATPERITPQTSGTHAYQIEPGGDFAIHRYSTMTSPPQIALVELPSHDVVRTMIDNQLVTDRVAAVRKGRSEFFRVDIGDGLELDGWIIRPPDFDASKRYPVLVYVYGEPAGQTVLDRWGGFNHAWHLMLAQRGYIVLSIDNRGTPAPRGRAWRKSVYRKIGIIAPQDQAAALRALQQRWSYLDPERTAIWGWSGGGSMSLNAIFRYPELYHTAMAIAFVADQRYYDTIYQERYMGLPADNVEGFRDGSPITHAHGLRGNLLLVYGTGDDNCHYQNCEALVDELIRHGKQFDMQIYPNRTHSISQGSNTRKHLFTRLTDYLVEHVPPGPR